MKKKTIIYSVLTFIFLVSIGFLLYQRFLSSNEVDTYKPGVYTIKDLEVTDTKTNSIFRIGMTKDELTEILGQETEILINNMYNFDGLHVFFRDNKVAAMMVNASDNISNRFITHRGVGLGTALTDVFERYGEEEINESYGAYTLAYNLGELNKKKFNKIDYNDLDDLDRIEQNRENIYIISLSFFDNDNKTLSHFFITDHMFAYSMM
jgi:hypothetical protein